jgi:hypothetical protein
MLTKLNKEDFVNSWKEIHPPVAETRAATEDELENEWYFDGDDDLANSFTDAQIELLFPKHALRVHEWHLPSKKEAAYIAVRTACAKLHLHPVNQYRVIKGRTAHIYKATEEYPIFLIDEVTFKVLYQPLHPEEKHRYTYYGDEHHDFVHGLQQAQAEMATRERALVETTVTLDKPDKNSTEVKPAKKLEPLAEILIVETAAEAFGAFLMGYWVCWKSRPESKLEHYQYVAMAKLCRGVYQVRQNTDVCHKRCHQRALDHLDLFTVELPPVIQITKDNVVVKEVPIVSLYDYLSYKRSADFKVLVEEKALPYRFWEMTSEYAGRGSERVWTGYKYDFDSVQAYNFLSKMGFFRLPVEGEKTEYIYVHKDGNIIRKRSANKIKNFAHAFVKDRKPDKKLRNMLYESNKLNETSLSNLEETEIDFTDYDADKQYLFFKNTTWEIGKQGIKAYQPGEVNRYVWEDDVIEHNVKVLDSPFTVKLHPDGKSYDITVNHTNCLFFNYLIQTSRVHWRKELEYSLADLTEPERLKYREEHKYSIAGPNLTPEEQMEQKQHLLNKIFAIGHLAHQYKDRSKAWAVVAFDANIPKDGRSHGRSGKSICFNQALPEVLKNTHHIPGTNADKTKDTHIFHGLDKYKKLLVIDDAHKYLDFRFFFEFITNDQVVNPKNSTPFLVKFKDLCKMAWLTNFSFSTDSSTEGRILYTVFSDYYHVKIEGNDYLESRDPKSDIGKQLFLEFDENEFNLFFNTMARCIQMYIDSPIKVSPPMSSVMKRNLQRDMGDEFQNWATVFFSEIAGNTDKLLVKDEVFQEYTSALGKNHKSTAQGFKKALESYCRFNGYVLNPEELINDKQNGRIIHQIVVRELRRDGGWNEGTSKKAKELVYIQTKTNEPVNHTLPGSPLPF